MKCESVEFPMGTLGCLGLWSLMPLSTIF